MTRTVSCPECGRELRVGDHLEGKQVRCPVCNHALTVGAAPPPESGEPILAVPADEELPAGAAVAHPLPEQSRPRP